MEKRGILIAVFMLILFVFLNYVIAEEYDACADISVGFDNRVDYSYNTLIRDVIFNTNEDDGLFCFNIVGDSMTFDCQGYTITCAGNNCYNRGGDAVVGIYTEKRNVTIKNCTVRNFGNGIEVNAGSEVTIVNNTLHNNNAGINIKVRSNYNKIINNVASNNIYDGILISGVGNNVSNNVVNNNNGSGIYISGTQDNSYYNVVANNIANNNGWSDLRDEYGKSGIYVYNSRSNILINNRASNNSQDGYGIYLYNSHGTNLTGNILNGNQGLGAYIYSTDELSVNNVSNNNICNNHGIDYGIGGEAVLDAGNNICDVFYRWQGGQIRDGAVACSRYCCGISSASISQNCGNNGCGRNERVSMRVVQTPAILGCSGYLSQGGEIVMDALGGRQGDQCVVRMQGIFDEQCADCSAAWSVPNNFDFAGAGCYGESVDVYSVKLYNKTGDSYTQIASKTGNFGSFSFIEEADDTPANVPPVAHITDVVGTAVEGEGVCGGGIKFDGGDIDSCFDINRDITFYQSSYDSDTITQQDVDGNITKWEWFINPPNNQQWISIGAISCPSGINNNCSNPNITYNFWNNNYRTSGNYGIKLIVTDNNSANDEDAKDISLWDGHSAFARIVSPLAYSLHEPGNILFNGTGFIPGSQQDSWSVNWSWFNGARWILMKGGAYNTTNRVFNYSFNIPLENYLVNFRIKDTHDREARTNVVFNISTCSLNDEFAFKGRCFAGTNNYCYDDNRMRFDCRQTNAGCSGCSDGEECSADGSECVEEGGGGGETGNCSLNENEPFCHDQDFCYWNQSNEIASAYCLTCYENDMPQSCSNYNNQQACEIDNCNMKNFGLGSDVCNPNSPSYIGAENCRCIWDSDSCSLGYEVNESFCQYSITYSECNNADCGENKREITYTSLNENENCPTRHECQLCGLYFKPLEFFEFKNIIFVLIMISVFYVIYQKKLKK